MRILVIFQVLFLNLDDSVYKLLFYIAFFASRCLKLAMKSRASSIRDSF